MSTVAPLNFERLLLEGAEEAERKYPRLDALPQPPGGPKPALEDALLNHYNRTRAPEAQLKSGELPQPIEQDLPPTTIGERVRTLSVPNVQLDFSTRNRTGRDDVINLSEQTTPGVTTTTSTVTSPATLDPRSYTSKRELHERRLAELPSKSRGVLADLGEAAYTITRDVVGGAFGAATAVSDILNAQLARIARGGPMASGPESPTHYRDIFNEMNKTINAVRYEPQSDIAKTAHKAVGGAAGIVSDLSELITKPIAYITGLDEDRAKVLSFAVELWAFSKLDSGVRRAASGVRSKLADFSDRMSKMRSDADYTTSGVEKAAQDLYTVVNRNPEVQRLIGEARQKLIGEAGKPGGEPSPTGEGPAPGGAAVDPVDLQTYKDTLRTRADELRKQGAGPTRIQNELNAVPKPQPKAAPAAEAAPTVERPVQPEVVVGQETAIAPRVPEAPTPEPPGTTTPEPTRPPASSEPRVITDFDILPPEAAATVSPETVPAPVSPGPATVAAVPTEPTSRQGYFGWEGTHTAESAIARAQELDILNTIRTDLNQGVTLEDAAANARQKATGRLQRDEAYAVVEAIKNNPEVVLAPLREMLNTGKLAELKSLARDAADGGNIITGLTRLGFPREEVRSIAEQLRKVRAKKAGTETLQQVAEKPAVQTALTEQELESQPAGTEVEIPAPSEPVINSTPVVDKPKRMRRVVKAPEATETAAPEPTYAMPRFYEVKLPELNTRVGEIAESGVQFPTGNAIPLGNAPLQIRATPGAKPDALFLDTSRIQTRTSLADIQTQTQSGRMSTDVSAALQANLARQAQLFGVPLEAAHTTTGQELTREATRIAAENDLDLYVKKGKNYELVPKDVVRIDARINSGDDLKPIPISKEAAGAYVESKTSPIGPAQIREIADAIERGVDISDKLPSELLPHYRQLRESERAGIDTSERRAFMDILTDILTSQSGSIDLRTVRMAAQRLQADARKAGKNVREFLFGARPEDVAIFERYLERINNPPPIDSTNPRNMRFDPTIPKNRGDRVVKQRKVSGELDLDAVPLWQSEVIGIQNARDIKAGGTHWDLKLPLRQHKAAGTEFLYYAYRTAQKNKNAALNDLHADMQELARGFSASSLEAIGANGYQRQGGDGQRILTYNKVTPRALTNAERNLQASIDRIYEETFNQLQESRAATGRPPLARVDSYQTFARTIGLLNHLGIKVDLARDDPAMINEMYLKHRATNFPYIVRKHAFYTAEFNALKILDRYMQSALSDIYLSPFLAKMHELIETRLPDPTTGEETWMLKDNKPGLYNELRTWTDFLATGTNMRISDKQRTILNTLNSNIAYATLSGLIRSGGIQISTLVNTQHALGPINTFNAIVSNLTDHLTGGKQKQFALDNSEILSSRKFIDAYNEVAGAIIGRRPRDFFHALRTGDLSSVQQAAGRPGFKLMELMDMEAAVMSWNGAYKQAQKKLGFNHKESVRYADDLVVRTQGSTMPGDLSGIQRNALGKLITQFQTFLISDWNFLTHEVLTKGKPGGGGGGQIPPGGVASGSGDWSVPESRSTFQLVKNVVGFLIATQLMNELFKLLHLQPAQPDPVKDVQQGVSAGHGPIGLAFDLAVGQMERIPIIGAMRYGKGITGPATETIRDLTRAARGDPLVRNPYEGPLRDLGIPKGEAQMLSRIAEPVATLLGIPGTRQVAKTALGTRRGESVYDSLMGWYSDERTLQRGRSERRERRSR